MIIPDLVGSIRNLLGELNIDQAVIDDVVNTLHTSSSDLDRSRFPDPARARVVVRRLREGRRARLPPPQGPPGRRPTPSRGS